MISCLTCFKYTDLPVHACIIFTSFKPKSLLFFVVHAYKGAHRLSYKVVYNESTLSQTEHTFLTYCTATSVARGNTSSQVETTLLRRKLRNERGLAKACTITSCKMTYMWVK